MRPRCWASVIKRCFIKFDSLGSIRGGRHGQIQKRRQKQKQTMIPTRFRQVLRLPDGKIRRTCLCNSVRIWDKQVTELPESCHLAYYVSGNVNQGRGKSGKGGISCRLPVAELMQQGAALVPASKKLMGITGLTRECKR